MRALGAELATRWRAGEVVLLRGPLGVGKTTLVRGILEGIGWDGAVRSPTFNLVQTFSTDPPVMHADLYRVESSAGIGLEEYLESHLCLIEWPDRLDRSFPLESCWNLEITFAEVGRTVRVHPPIISV